MGLCWGIDHAQDARPSLPVLRALDQPDKLVKPPVLHERGAITLPDVMAVYHQSGDVQDLVAQVHLWAENVWTAYASQHDTARSWLK